jgi:hypothetical protein
MARVLRLRTLVAAAAMVALIAANAQAQDVKTDFDPGASFTSYKTYFWAKTDPIPGNDLMNARVLEAVDKWLTAKGWTKGAEAQADVAVVANVSTAERKSLDTFYSGGGMGGWGYYGGWRGGMGTASTQVNTYTDGTMVVDLFDTKTKKLVWRGMASDTLSKDPKKNANKIVKATEKMFKKNFPPGVADSAKK